MNLRINQKYLLEGEGGVTLIGFVDGTPHEGADRFPRMLPIPNAVLAQIRHDDDGIENVSISALKPLPQK